MKKHENKYFLKILGLMINFLLIILVIANFSSFVNALEEPSSPDEEWYPPPPTYENVTLKVTMGIEFRSTSVITPSPSEIKCWIIDSSGKERNEQYRIDKIYLVFETDASSFYFYLYEWYPPGTMPKGHWLFYRFGPIRRGAGVYIVGYFYAEPYEPEGVHTWKIWLYDENNNRWATGIIRFNYRENPLASIQNVEIPSEMKLNKEYEAKVYVKNTGEIKCQYDIVIEGDGFTFSPFKTKVDIEARSLSSISFKIIPRSTGTKSIAFKVLIDSKVHDTFTTTVSVKVLKPGPMVEAGINPIICIQNKEERFEVSFINKGEGMAYDVSAKIIDAPGFEIIKGEDFSANIASGSNGKVDFILKPLIGGWKNIKILIKYMDEEGKNYENTIEYKINVHIILRISSPIKTWIKINDEMFIGEIEKEMEVGKIKIEANPLIEEDNTRYEFIEWSDGIKENPREIDISSSLILNANYITKYLLIIKYEPEDIPIVKSKKLWQESNKIVYSDIAQNEIQINDDEKYVFKSWYIDGSPIAGNPISFSMNSPHEIIAKYVKYYKIIIISEYGFPSKEIEKWYEKDKEMPLPILESPISNGFGIKYVFDHWEGEGILSPYSIEASVIVDKPKTIKAIWRTDYTDLMITIISLISIIAIVAIILKIKMKKIEEGTRIYRSENGTIPYKRILFNELFLKKIKAIKAVKEHV